MRYIVQADMGDYGPLYLVDVRHDGTVVNGEFSAAKRFDSYPEALDLAGKAAGGYFVATVDEPRVFRSLHDASVAVAELRADLLYDDIALNLPRYAEQEYLLALSCLEQAERHLKLGWFDQMQPK